MREIVIYLADDGKIFQDFYDCQEYELTQEVKKHRDKDVDFYDKEEGTITDPAEIINGQTVWEMSIWSTDGLKLIKQLNEWNSLYENINAVGRWKYNDGWCLVEV